MDQSIYITAAKRSPIGAFQGQFAEVSAIDLGAQTIRSLVSEDSALFDMIDEVIMGCVLPAGLGQAPARQAMLGAGVCQSAGALTINKVCGSGLKAVMLAADLITAQSAHIVIAGGMESMTQAPYLLPSARAGQRMGHGQMIDHMMLDGLENAYDGKSMGTFAQAKADAVNLTREAMDEFAIASLNKAQSAVSAGLFTNEITPITVSHRRQTVVIDTDETPGQVNVDKIPLLRPAFAKEGTVTAANSSSISDGAAALLVMSEQAMLAHKMPPLAKIVGHATAALAPSEFTIAPIDAIQTLLNNTGWTLAEVDLFEINEAFAMVTIVCSEKLAIPMEKVNVNGGACALGHPIGASGARILVTLIHALQQRGKKKGIASLCIGGGEAVAVAVEII